MTQDIYIDTVTAGISIYKDNEYLKNWKYNKKQENYYLNIDISESNSVFFSYYPKWQYLNVKLNIPKFIFGTNEFVPKKSQMDDFLIQINKLLKNMDLPANFEKYKVSRADLTCNYKYNTENDLDILLNQIKKITVPYKKKHIYPTSVSFFNKSQTVIIYNKEEEVKNHQNKCPDALTTKILRVEIQCKKRFFKTHGHYTVEDILNDNNTLYNDCLRDNNLKLNIETEASFFKKIKIELFKCDFSEKVESAILDFFEFINKNGEEAAKAKSRYYYGICRKLAKQAGVNLIYTDKKIKANTYPYFPFSCFKKSISSYKKHIKNGKGISLGYSFRIISLGYSFRIINSLYFKPFYHRRV